MIAQIAQPNPADEVTNERDSNHRQMSLYSFLPPASSSCCCAAMLLRSLLPCHRCSRITAAFAEGRSRRWACSTVENEPVQHSLKHEIMQSIKISGPMTVAEYMKFVLTHPILGFYMKQDVFGSKGHFTTNPEISQIFGELLGAWLVNEWQRHNKSTPFRIIELGPGRGTLANDVTRVVRKFSGPKDDVSLHLIEVSDHLKKMQEEATIEVRKKGLPVHWYKSIDEIDLKNGFNAFVAHEFFDALPIHKFQRDAKGQFCEIMVDAKGESDLQFVISNASTPASKFFTRDATADQQHIEICPEAAIVTDKILDQLNRENVSGCLLICDYGYNGPAKVRDTFRGFKNHKLWDPLSDPGSADLTADVDFDFLAKIAAGKATVFGPVTQRDFLERLGISVRLQMLVQGTQDEKEKADLISGVKMMIMTEMGERFMFMCFFPLKAVKLLANNPPAGFLPIETVA